MCAVADLCFEQDCRQPAVACNGTPSVCCSAPPWQAQSSCWLGKLNRAPSSLHTANSPAAVAVSQPL